MPEGSGREPRCVHALDQSAGGYLALDTREREVRSHSIAVAQDRPPTLISQSLVPNGSSTNNPSFLHIAEGALARPGSPVRIAQFYSGEDLLIRKANVDADRAVAEFCNGACGQDKMGR